MLYAQGMFYNGIFGALIKTGLPGLFCTLTFVWLVSRLALEVVRLVRLRRVEEQDRFDRLCLVLCAQWFAMVASFYFTIGDMNAWMQFFGFPAGLIMLSRRLLLERVASENSTTEPVAG